MHTMRITAIEDFTLALPTRTPAPKPAPEPARAHLAAQPAGALAATDLPTLVQTYSPLLFRVAHAILRNPAEAEDVVQDTFVRVLQHQEKLPGLLDPKVWLVRIAWRLAVDRRRRIRPAQLDDVSRLTDSTQPADAALAQSQSIRNVLAEIDRLPTPERDVLLLSALDELPTPEIAAILRRSESAVRALLARARARLKQRLDKSPEQRPNQRPNRPAIQSSRKEKP